MPKSGSCLTHAALKLPRPDVVQGVTTIAADSDEETVYAQSVVHRNGTLYLRVEPLNAETYFASVGPGESMLEEVPLTGGCAVGPVMGDEGTLYGGCGRGGIAFPAAGAPSVVLPSGSPVTALAIGSNGTLYATFDEPRDRIIGIHPSPECVSRTCTTPSALYTNRVSRSMALPTFL